MRFREIIHPEQKMSFAVVGLRQGCNHIESLLSQPNTEVVAICDKVREHRQRAQDIIADTGREKAEEFDDLDKLLENVSVDGICLALPIALNGMAAIKSLKTGFNTFCEKPIANNFPEAQEIRKLVGETGLIYQVGFELRHSPLVQSVMSQIEAGKIGQVTAISAYHFWRPNQEHFNARGEWAYSKWSGSVLMDCMSHTFDMLNLFVGSSVTQMYADLGFVTDEYKDRGAPEVGAVSIGYENGVKVSVGFTETCHQPHSTLITIAGTNGKIEIHFADAGDYKMWHGKDQTLFEESIDPTTTCPGHLGWDEQFIEFRNALSEKRQPYCGYAAGIESLVCSAGAILSNDANRPLSRQEILESKIGD